MWDAIARQQLFGVCEPRNSTARNIAVRIYLILIGYWGCWCQLWSERGT